MYERHDSFQTGVKCWIIVSQFHYYFRRRRDPFHTIVSLEKGFLISMFQHEIGSYLMTYDE